MWNPFSPTANKRRTPAINRELEHEMAERERFLQEKARLASMGVDLDEPEELLICPQCRTRYDFGSTCPDCHVVLVGESCLHLTIPERPLYHDGIPRILELLLVFLAIIAALALSGYLCAQFL